MYVLRTSCMYSILTVMAPFQNHISMIGNPFIKPHVVIYNRTRIQYFTISFRVLQTNDGLHPKEKSTSNSLLDIDHYSLTYQRGSLWFVRIKNSLKTQKYENHLNDILGCLINQFLHELNDMNLFLQCNKLKNQKTCWKYCKISVFFKKRQFLGKNTDITPSQTSQL